MGRVEGKVAFISGVARGQGRSHAVRLAQEGASIIGFDVCEDNPNVEYPLATGADLEETVRLIEAEGQKAFVKVADVRDRDAVKACLDEGVAQFGRLDIVLANAGIMPIVGESRLGNGAWVSAIEVMLTGVWNVVELSIPALRAGGNGGAIVITSSTAGLVGGISDGSPGTLGYIASKHGVVGIMRGLTRVLAPDNIRINTVHPTGVATQMIMNEAFGQFVQENPEIASNLQNPLEMPNGLLDPSYVSETILNLVSDTGKYTTGSTVVIDGGFTAH